MKSLRKVNIVFMHVFYLFLVVFLVMFFQGCGGGGDGAAEEETVAEPAPAIGSIEPTTVYQGITTGVDVTVMDPTSLINPELNLSPRTQRRPL